MGILEGLLGLKKKKEAIGTEGICAEGEAGEEAGGWGDMGGGKIRGKAKSRSSYEVEKAPEIQAKIEGIIEALEPAHINQFRIICMRSRGATARAYARIWSMPKIWQKALDISTFYVIEVLSEHFEPLSEEEKTKVLIHELMHIPKTFSGALLPHNHRGGHIGKREVERIYSEYVKRKKSREEIAFAKD